MSRADALKHYDARVRAAIGCRAAVPRDELSKSELRDLLAEAARNTKELQELK